MSSNKAFAQWKKARDNHSASLRHITGCFWSSRNVPLDACGCDCYEWNLFLAGYRAAKGVAE
jgi:hypothetical protein